MGILALISSGVVDGLRDRLEPATSSPAGQQRVVSADVGGRAHVLDGDTIEVGGVRVRLEGLHCPEAGDPGGSAVAAGHSGDQRLDDFAFMSWDKDALAAAGLPAIDYPIPRRNNRKRPISG